MRGFVRSLMAAFPAALALAGCASGWPGSDASASDAAVVASARLAADEPQSGDPGYRIGPEDTLDISVWKEEALKGMVLVRPDGGISFPLAGDLQAAGKTASQVRDELVRRIARFVPEPEVTVAVAKVASYRIFVIGRVNKPGDFTVGRAIDVLQALSMAGGLTPFASEDGIRIIRRIDGRSQSIGFDYSRVRKGGDLSQNIALKSGDVLFVP
jgi:polysaccharide export outer membrane protein